METQRRHILDASPEELAMWLRAQDEPPYRLDQVLDWVCAKRVDSFEAMANVPAALRARMAEAFSLAGLKEARRSISDDGFTGKMVFELTDGEEVESVWMNDDGRLTFCISSQAGCSLGCRFCATGAGGFGRDLTTGEILGQIVALSRAAGGLRNVVFMGMGEPLLNLDSVIPALEALTDRRRFALSPRHVTVSTAGITPGINRLAESGVRPSLALSLNSPFNQQRSELMPVNRRYPLPELLKACANYTLRTGRRVLLEYVLIHDVNTSEAAARGVARIAARLRALVNLITFNPVPGCGFRPPSRQEVVHFRLILETEGAEVTQRFRRGRDIAAACGQLAGKHPQRLV